MRAHTKDERRGQRWAGSENPGHVATQATFSIRAWIIVKRDAFFDLLSINEASRNHHSLDSELTITITITITISVEIM